MKHPTTPPPPPLPNPAENPPSVHGMSGVRPSQRPIDRPRPVVEIHDSAQSYRGGSFHFSWRHVTFFFVIVSCIGVTLMIVYGGAR